MKDPKPVVNENELKKFYKENSQKYMTKETYDIYHLEMDSEKSLKDKLKGVKNLEAFKDLAGKHSLNSWTKPLGGKVGVIKKAHCLPYGIGMFPKLFPLLDSLDMISSALLCASESILSMETIRL